MSTSTNPLLADWSGPYRLPPYATTRVEHFLPAFDAAMAAHLVELDVIATDPAAATFDNTVVPLERAGELLSRVAAMFYGLTGTDTTPQLQVLERELAPKLTAHHLRLGQDARLFARIDAIDGAKASLDDEQRQVLDRYVRMFVRAGARLDAAGQARIRAIGERLSTLSTRFNQNVLKDEQDRVLWLEHAPDLAGLDPGLVAAAAATAERLGRTGAWAITLSRSSIVPFLEQSTRRDLRERAYLAWTARGATGGATDNRAILAEIVALRAESAALLGHATFADMGLEHAMAKTPANVLKLLSDVWGPARAAAIGERDLLQAAADAEQAGVRIAAWDWRHYAEKVRRQRFDLDDAEIKPYLGLEPMIAAMFDCATRLFGLRFQEQGGVALHNPEARLWEVTRNGQHVGVFIGDFFARPSKRSGAWMSQLRRQHRLPGWPGGGETPIVTNTCNFAKPAPGTPALLSIDDARTLFHEFGHALHGLLSNVTYGSVSGTAVARDFVELPSQLYEHWLMTPHVLKNFARHCETGEPMPDALIARIEAARAFGQGFSTVEYLGSAFVDMDLHARGANAVASLDIDEVERDVRARLQMPAEIALRHRPGHFLHINGGYAAGYYSYLWSEVLDSDAFRAFEETGDVFDAGVARRLYEHVYSAGGKREPDAAYIGFRGRLPDISALLAKRGFPPKAAA
jgi:peptidyl-dipeptidase Dcp